MKILTPKTLFMGLATTVAIFWSAFQVYINVGLVDYRLLKFVHMSFAFFLTFLLYGSYSRKKSQFYMLVDFLLALVSVIPLLYFVINFDRLDTRIPFMHDMTQGDIFTGILLIIIGIETTRRAIGWPLAILTVAFIGYGLYGDRIPGIFGHSGIPFRQFLEYQYLSFATGIFGIPIAVSATFMFLFILFGTLLERSGVNNFLMALAMKTVGKTPGGPAKLATATSLMFASISGSSIANVTTTGVITIPMMKRAGYKPVFAGAVEAAASTGGQIMPPVMGASAFIMAEILGTPYRTIIIAALIPAFLFYISIYSAVHFRAARLGLPGLTDKDLPPGFTVWKNFHLVVPVTVIVYCLLTGFSPGRSALYASVTTACIIVLRSFTKLRKGQNKTGPSEQGLPKLRILGIGDILYAMERAGKTCVVIATACVSAGIIIGVVSQSGLALRFSRVLLHISGGTPILLACFLAIAALILGVGMPTTPAYVTVSVLLVPALVRVGYLDIAAHLFALHFAVISFITPPVALAAFAAAGISGGKAMSIAFTAARIAIAGFIVPFLFLYDHSLLMKGPPVGIIFSFLCVAIAVISLASFFERFLLVPLSRWERAIALLTSIAFLLHTIPLNRIIGLVLFLAFILNQIRKKRGLTAMVLSDTDFSNPNSTTAKH